jgi:hypothetical protein
MNEHIKKLFDRALDQAVPETWTQLSHEQMTKFSSVFAELLIRQCCIALNPMLRDMISRGQGVELIKLHFGMNPKEITTAMLDAAITQCEQELAKKKSGVE